MRRRLEDRIKITSPDLKKHRITIMQQIASLIIRMCNDDPAMFRMVDLLLRINNGGKLLIKIGPTPKERDIAEPGIPVAAYDPRENTIYLTKYIIGSKMPWLLLLRHELVHAFAHQHRTMLYKGAPADKQAIIDSTLARILQLSAQQLSTPEIVSKTPHQHKKGHLVEAFVQSCFEARKVELRQFLLSLEKMLKSYRKSQEYSQLKGFYDKHGEHKLIVDLTGSPDLDRVKVGAVVPLSGVSSVTKKTYQYRITVEEIFISDDGKTYAIGPTNDPLWILYAWLDVAYKNIMKFDYNVSESMPVSNFFKVTFFDEASAILLGSLPSIFAQHYLPTFWAHHAKCFNLVKENAAILGITLPQHITQEKLNAPIQQVIADYSPELTYQSRKILMIEPSTHLKGSTTSMMRHLTENPLALSVSTSANEAMTFDFGQWGEPLFDTANQQFIHVYEVYSTGHEQAVGTAHFYATKDFCRGSDGRHNIVKLTGVLEQFSAEIDRLDSDNMCEHLPPNFSEKLFLLLRNAMLLGGIHGITEAVAEELHQRGHVDKSRATIAGKMTFYSLFMILRTLHHIGNEHYDIHTINIFDAVSKAASEALLFGVFDFGKFALRNASERFIANGHRLMGNVCRTSSYAMDMVGFGALALEHGLFVIPSAAVSMTSSVAAKLGVCSLTNWFCGKPTLQDRKPEQQTAIAEADIESILPNHT